MGIDLTEMSTETLWIFHEQVTAELVRKATLELARLDDHLKKITSNPVHRPYPKVCPKYHNPENPNALWSGRGKQPRWLVEELRSGRTLDDFLIRPSYKKLDRGRRSSVSRRSA